MEISFKLRTTLVDEHLVYTGDRPQDDLEAVEVSIVKWATLTEIGRYVNDGGISTCGLCMIHLARELTCGACPIAERYGQFCKNTPYEDYLDGQVSPNDDGNSAVHAKRELDLLIALREELQNG